jgi:hypothetical protein
MFPARKKEEIIKRKFTGRINQMRDGKSGLKQ